MVEEEAVCAPVERAGGLLDCALLGQVRPILDLDQLRATIAPVNQKIGPIPDRTHRDRNGVAGTR